LHASFERGLRLPVQRGASQDVPEIFNDVANPSENKLEAFSHGAVAVLPKAMELLRRHGREQNEHWSRSQSRAIPWNFHG